MTRIPTQTPEHGKLNFLIKITVVAKDAPPNPAICNYRLSEISHDDPLLASGQLTVLGFGLFCADHNKKRE